MQAGSLGSFLIKFSMIKHNTNRHPYIVDERFLSGKVVVMYVKYRFLHNWVFIALTPIKKPYKRINIKPVLNNILNPSFSK